MSSLPPSAPVPPPPGGRPGDDRPLHKRKRIWFGGTVLSLLMFSCGAVAGTEGDTDSGKKAGARPEATVTVPATETRTETAEAKPAPTVTATETKKVEVTATETITTDRGGSGGSEGSAASGDGGGDANTSGLPPGPGPGPDVDCSDLSGPVWVGDNDPHRLDRDGDGIGCDG